MRTSLSLNTRTSNKTQYSLRNIFLSFSITLFIASLLLVINTVGVSEESYANQQQDIRYKIKEQVKETEAIPSSHTITQ